MSRQKDNYENSRWLKFKRWVDGDVDLLEKDMETVPQPKREVSGQGEMKAAEVNAHSEEKGLRIYRRVYQVMSVILCLSIIFVLLWTTAYLPALVMRGTRIIMKYPAVI